MVNYSGARECGMPNYVAMLRGVNVAGSKRVAMGALKELFEALGAQDVQTYVQSGNVVFKSGSKSPAKLEKTIEDRIGDELGLSVRVVVRSKHELRRIVAKNPFLAAKKDPATLHVTFLADKPSAARVRDIDTGAGGPDEFRIEGQEVYLHCPNGYGRTKLNNAFFEKKLGVAATTRNWKTVTTLARLAAE
jgi:uncharacterized protein (DUF1697 family)